MLKVQRIFRRNWSHFWATTYSFDITGFEDYLLWNLGLRCSSTVLADANRMARYWQDMAGAEEAEFLERVNRQYLLRGLPWPGAVFHPKTYFFLSKKEAMLLVGSGNLGLSGLLDGYETFVTFDANDTAGREAIAGWRRWTEHLVRTLGDEQTSNRWRRLSRELEPLLKGAVGEGSFVTNLHRPLLEQLIKAIGGTKVDQLLLTAPFFDRDCHALDELLSATHPRSVTLHLGGESSVDGKRLNKVLHARAPKVRVLALGVEGMVHSKLVGVVTGSRGFLLSGSANLSTPALLKTASVGNMEAGVLVEGSASDIRSAFLHPDFDPQPFDPSRLEAFTFRTVLEPAAPNIKLLRATWLADDSVEVLHSPAVGLRLQLSAGALVRELELAQVGNQVHMNTAYMTSSTHPATPLRAHGLLAQLLGSDGTAVSNLVPVDDPVILESVFVDQERRSQPPELKHSDLATPIGQLLDLLQESCSFDYLQDAAARRRHGRAIEDEYSIDPEGEITLAFEDAPGSGVRLGRWSGRDADELFQVLHSMLQQVPSRAKLRIASGPLPKAELETRGHLWSEDARLGVRVRNLLRRWCAAVADPFAWEETDIVVSNYVGLLRGLTLVTESDELIELIHEDAIVGFCDTLLTGVLALFKSLTPENQEAVRSALAEVGAPEDAAALMGWMLDEMNSEWRTLALSSKTLLVEGIETGLLNSKDAGLMDLLRLRAAYMEPDYWCGAEGERLGLEIAIAHDPYGIAYDVQLEVEGCELVSSPKITTLLSDLVSYLHPAKLLLGRKTTGEILVVCFGEEMTWRLGDEIESSSAPVTAAMIVELSARGGSLRELLPAVAHVA